MSAELLVIAIDRTVGRGPRAAAAARKPVLLALCSFADNDGSRMFASHAAVAARAECTDRAVRNCLSDFEAEGLIRRVGKRGRVVEWRIDVASLKALTIAKWRRTTRKDVPPSEPETRKDVPPIAEGRSARKRKDVPTTLSFDSFHDSELLKEGGAQEVAAAKPSSIAPLSSSASSRASKM